MFGWLTVAWALTFGFVPEVDTMVLQYQKIGAYTQDKNAYVVTLELEATAFDCLRLWGKNETYMYPVPDSVTFAPYRADYSIGACLYGEGIEVGIWHECDHGVLSSSSPKPWFASNETQVYIKFSGSTK